MKEFEHCLFEIIFRTWLPYLETVLVNDIDMTLVQEDEKDRERVQYCDVMKSGRCDMIPIRRH